MKRQPPPTYNFYENDAWARSKLVCGIDEVGRGCLAGPLVTAAVILPPHCSYPLKDSKKLSPKAREKAYEWLSDNATFAIARADHHTIEKHNIYQATLRAMKKACLLLAHHHSALFADLAYITVDAMPLILAHQITQPPIASFIKGEDHSASIAAASIVAKVTRDRLMEGWNAHFPLYQFAQDKAYASPTHCQKLRTGPATFVHRTQFIRTVRTPKESF